MSEQFHSEYERVLIECLDAIIEGRRSAAQCLAAYPAFAREMAPSLRMAENLRGAQVIRPSLGFRKQAASRLQQRIAASSRPPRTKSVRPVSRRQGFLPGLALRLGVALILVALLAGFSGAAAYASDGAVPGDTLYGIDTAVETIQLSFTMNADRALTLQLEIATERLGEAESLLESGDIEHAAEALEAYNSTVAQITVSNEQISVEDQGGTADSIETTLSQHQVRLQALLIRVPEQARPGIERAIEASKHGQEQANKHKPEKDDKTTPSGQDGQEPATGTQTGTSGEATETSGSSSDIPGNGNSGTTGNGTGSANGQGNGTGTGSTGNGNGQGNDNGQGNGNSSGSSDDDPGSNNGNGQGTGGKDEDKTENDNGTPAAKP